MKPYQKLLLSIAAALFASNALAYDFPIENRWKATVVGTPPGYRAELPEEIPLKKRRIEIFDPHQRRLAPVPVHEDQW